MSQLANEGARRDVNAKKVRSFADWRALVTGGSSGIGLELAKALVRAGAHVCIVARDEQRLSEATRELSALVPAGGKAPCFVRMDLASAVGDIAAGLRHAIASLGGLDLLINNAGYAEPGYIDQVEDQAYVDMMAVNYFGAMRLSRACLQHFISEGQGRIVNVTSTLAFVGIFGFSAYCASKYAIAGFTEALRQEASPFGVRVHLCYPPTTKTKGLERENLRKPPETWAIEGKAKAMSAPDVAQAILKGVRAGRFHVVVSFDNWIIWFAQRLAPWLVRLVADRTLLKALRSRTHGHALGPPTASD